MPQLTFFFGVAAIIAVRCAIPASEMQKQIVCGSGKSTGRGGGGRGREGARNVCPNKRSLRGCGRRRQRGRVANAAREDVSESEAKRSEIQGKTKEHMEHKKLRLRAMWPRLELDLSLGASGLDCGQAEQGRGARGAG